jgi:WD40 repeat protein
MTARDGWPALLVGLLLSLPALAQGQGPDKPRLDRNGDPLPPGAVARLGADRFRHDDAVRAVAVSPDSKAVAAVDHAYTLRLWDLATGRELRRLGTGLKVYHAVAFSPDGKHVAAPTAGGLLRLWEAATGKEVRSFKGPGGTYACFVFSPDGKTLAIAWPEDTGKIRLWDVASGKPLRVIKGHVHRANDLAFSPDGKALASGGYDRTVRIWEVSSARQLHRMEGHEKEVDSVAFLPDGMALVSGSSDRTVRVWDAAAGKERPKGNWRTVFSSFTLSPDGRFLAPTYAGGVPLYEPTTGRETRWLDWNRGWIKAGAFSRDGKLLVTGGDDGAVRVWDTATGKERRPVEGHRSHYVSARFLPDGTVVTTAWGGRTVRWWDPHTGRQVRTSTHAGRAVGAVASPDGRLLVIAEAGDHKYALQFRDLETGKVLREVKCEKDDGGWPYFSPDGKTLVTLGKGIQLWDPDTGKVVYRLKGEVKLWTPAFSPDGKTLAFAWEKEPGVVLWDLATRKEVRRLTQAPKEVSHLAFSPDGKTLAAGGLLNDPTIPLWDVRTGKLLRRLRAETGPTRALAFSPDGKLLATAVGWGDSNVYLWDPQTGRVRGVFAGHHSAVWSVSFSRDGKRLVTGSADGTALVWDVALAGKPRRLLGEPFTARELEEHWTALGGTSADDAQRFTLSLAADPERSVPFLKARLKPVPAPDAKRVAALLRALEKGKRNEQEKAERELEKLGELVAAELRAAMREDPPRQVWDTLDGLLQKLKTRPPSADTLRTLRAVDVLEWAGTKEARQLLEALARGSPQANLTRAARAAVRRLAGEKTPSPSKKER